MIEPGHVMSNQKYLSLCLEWWKGEIILQGRDTARLRQEYAEIIAERVIAQQGK